MVAFFLCRWAQPENTRLGVFLRNQDLLVCENLLSLHPFPSSQEENVDEVTEETTVSKKLTQSLITSQVISSFSQKIIQSLNGDASELIEEAK